MAPKEGFELEGTQKNSEQQKNIDGTKIEKNIHEAKIWWELGKLDGKIETWVENIEIESNDKKISHNTETKTAYIPQTISEQELLNKANTWRLQAGKNLQNNITQYEKKWILGNIIRRVNKRDNSTIN